jgi:hypothetical protein
MPLFMTSTLAVGGLNFSTTRIGTYTAILGACFLVFQLTLYHHIPRILGFIKTVNFTNQYYCRYFQICLKQRFILLVVSTWCSVYDTRHTVCSCRNESRLIEPGCAVGLCGGHVLGQCNFRCLFIRVRNDNDCKLSEQGSNL